jgi:TonB family protein
VTTAANQKSAKPGPGKPKPELRPTVLSSRRQQPLWSLKNDDDRLIIAFVAVSIVAHTLFFVVEGLDIFKQRSFITDEWVMDAEIIADVDLAGLEKSALPNAKPAEEVKVSEQMLPQITKTFSVKEDTKPEDSVAEEKIKEKEKEKEDKKEAAKPEKTEDLNVKTPNKEDNKLDQKEAQKRLAMEKLRQLSQTAKTNEAQTDSANDVAASILKNLKGGISGGTARGKQIINQYVAMVRRAVHGNYTLPDAYNLKGAAMQVMIAVVVSERGDIMKIDIEESSGDGVFDSLTLNAVKASSPLPKPPKELAGEKILLVFKP